MKNNILLAALKHENPLLKVAKQPIFPYIDGYNGITYELVSLIPKNLINSEVNSSINKEDVVLFEENKNINLDDYIIVCTGKIVSIGYDGTLTFKNKIIK